MVRRGPTGAEPRSQWGRHGYLNEVAVQIEAV